MTISLIARGLKQAGWNEEIIQNLAARKCGGMEFSTLDMLNTIDENEVIALALNHARLKIQESINAPEYWVITGNSAIQPDSAVGRRRGFWRSLGSLFPAGLENQATEWHVRCRDGLKFFTAIRKDHVCDELLLRLWHRERTTWLVACNGCDAETFHAHLANGWPPERSAVPEKLMELASSLPIILVRGLITDDGKAIGVVAFGQFFKN